jgi:superfamily I DNA/RNA helicase
LDGDDGGGDESEIERPGDKELKRLSRYRGLMFPREGWPATLVAFEKRWTEYKQENGLLDFTDLIDVCQRDVPFAPRNPSVIFADEAQDLNRMQLKLIRTWGAHAQYFIVAGDDDQTVFSFTGASPEAFLDPDIPEDHKIVLKQSYRVPRAVHGLAEDLVRRLTRRQPKEYLPRPEDGSLVRFSRGGYKSAEFAILNTAVEHLERGKTIMFLVACGYMLRAVTAVLRKHGIPFHNPYRKSNGYWNPLRQATRGSTVSRILSLLIGHPEYGTGHRPWTNGDLAAWAEHLQAKGVLRHGVKKTLAGYAPEATASMERLDSIFEPAALHSLMEAWDKGYRELLEWWRARVTADVHARVQFPADIASRRGPYALASTPQVTVGTIHSVKGGEADIVYIFPDLSQSGAAQYARGGPARDSVIRQFYVGATRAREGLYICRAESSQAIGI